MIPTHRPPTHPGEMLLREFLEPAKLSQTDAARRLGMSINRLNELINGKRGMTPDTALRLAELFPGVTAQFWMGLQVDYDLWYAKQARKARGEARVRPIAKAS